ncbi:MAG: ATP-binding protein [Planctomycetota bacterium]
MILFKKHKTGPEPVRETFLIYLNQMHRLVDRIFATLLILQWVFAIACAVFISPLAWDGGESHLHIHVAAAVILGGLITVLPVALAFIAPCTSATRLVIASAQAMFSALLIHLMGGRIEAHFHVFVSLALLSAYRDRTVFLPVVLITAVDHVVRGWYWPQSVFGDQAIVTWRPLEHLAWVIFAVACLSFLINQSLQQLWMLAKTQCDLLTERDGLEQRVQERTEELWNAKTFQDQILNSMDARIAILDSKGEVLFVNQRWMDFGVQHDGAGASIGVGSNYLQQCEEESDSAGTTPESLEALRAICAGEGRSYLGEYALPSDDEWSWFQLRIKAIDVNGEHAVAVVHVDISETKKAQSHASSLATLLLNSPTEVFICDASTTRFVEANQGACLNLGYTRSELLAMTPLEINPDFTQEQLDDAVSKATAESVVSFETRHLRKDGSDYWCDVSLHRSMLNDQEVLVAFVVDQTQRRELEKRLRQAQKLESMGQLAAGVAHEINTPMQCVFSNVEFLDKSFHQLMKLSDEMVDLLKHDEVVWLEEKSKLETLRAECRYDFLREQTPKAIDDASKASNRVISIVRAMKAMSHPGTKEKVTTDLNELIENASMITRSRWKMVAELELDLEEDLECIDLLPAEISQTLINLFVNAGDAIASAVGEDPEELGLILVTTRTRGDQVELTVSDTGCGIPEAVVERVFDPFFTTKDVGKGTGQGLAITHEVIVSQHGGKIDVDSRPGTGTSFRISLPRFAEAPSVGVTATATSVEAAVPTHA